MGLLFFQNFDYYHERVAILTLIFERRFEIYQRLELTHMP